MSLRGRTSSFLITLSLLCPLVWTGCGGGGGTALVLPAAPGSVQIVVGNAMATLTWAGVTGATSYHIYWKAGPGITKQNSTKVANVTSPYPQTGLTNGTNYCFRVVAANANGESPLSEEKCGIPAAPALPPDAPSNVQATPGYQNAVIFWDVAPGATSYNLYWLTQPGVTKQNGTKVSGIAATSFSHAGLTNGTTYFYVVTAENASDESVESTEVSATPGDTLTQIPGPPNAPANTYLPDIEFPEPPPEDIVAPNGIPISIRDLTVISSDIATVQQVNSLLQSLPAVIVGGNPRAKLLLIRLVGASDLQRVLDAEAGLLSDPLIRAASMNYAHAEERFPPHNVETTNNRWTWEVPLNPASGNWGLKAIRAPQAWNLYGHSHRKNATIQALVAEAGVANVADPAHPDLTPRIDVFSGTSPSEHATMVAGFISASWDNSRGVEGVYPRNLRVVSRGASFWGTLQDTVARVLNARLNVRVVNYSAGTSAFYANNAIDPVTTPLNPALPVQNNPVLPNYNPTWRVRMNSDGNTFLTALQNYATGAGGRTDWLMFCSAGNSRLRPGTGLDYEARDNSACANVAVRGVAGAGMGADHFLTVEAMDSAGNRSSFSASAGTVSAPGTCVRSTEYNDGTNYDRDICPGDDVTDPDYATNNGTSFATPHVTGLAAYLWSLDPNLRYDQVRQAIASPSSTVAVPAGSLGGAAGSPRIDAFSAVMGIDVLLGSRDLQKALVDVDDGTPDGNQRTRRDDNGAVIGDFTPITTPDGMQGDGKVSMADFRAFRDAMIQAGLEDWDGDLQPDLIPADTELDGAVNHPKKDLNSDGCVFTSNYPGGAADCSLDGLPENLYPRFDFNGDGQVMRYETVGGGSGFLPFKGNDWTDLDVILDVWPTDPDLNEGWNASELADLLPTSGPLSTAKGSADVEFRSLANLGPSGTWDEIRVTITVNGQPRTRSLTPGKTRIVWTLPAGKTHGVTLTGYKGGSQTGELCTSRSEIPALRHGEDFVISIFGCGGPVITMSHGMRAGYIGGVYSTYVSGDFYMVASGPETTICSLLQVGEVCDGVVAKSQDYGYVTALIRVWRVAENEWEITASLENITRAPPLVFPPNLPPEFNCTTPPASCMSYNESHVSADIRLFFNTPGMHLVTVECEASGDVLASDPRYPTTNTSETRLDFTMWNNPPQGDCDSPPGWPPPGPPGWSFNETHQYTFDTTDPDTSFWITVQADANALNSTGNGPDAFYEDSVTTRLTRFRVRLEPPPP